MLVIWRSSCSCVFAETWSIVAHCAASTCTCSWKLTGTCLARACDAPSLVAPPRSLRDHLQLATSNGSRRSRADAVIVAKCARSSARDAQVTSTIRAGSSPLLTTERLYFPPRRAYSLPSFIFRQGKRTILAVLPLSFLSKGSCAFSTPQVSCHRCVPSSAIRL